MICDVEISKCVTCDRGVSIPGDRCYLCDAVYRARLKHPRRSWWSARPKVILGACVGLFIIGFYLSLFYTAITVNTRRIEGIHADRSAIAETRVDAMDRVLTLRKKGE